MVDCREEDSDVTCARVNEVGIIGGFGLGFGPEPSPGDIGDRGWRPSS